MLLLGWRILSTKICPYPGPILGWVDSIHVVIYVILILIICSCWVCCYFYGSWNLLIDLLYCIHNSKRCTDIVCTHLDIHQHAQRPDRTHDCFLSLIWCHRKMSCHMLYLALFNLQHVYRRHISGYIHREKERDWDVTAMGTNNIFRSQKMITRSPKVRFHANKKQLHCLLRIFGLLL